MKVRLWGTRGSIASPGPSTARYGGNTSCVEVRGRGGELLVLDAGTGMRPLGVALAREDNDIHVLLTHLHIDHIQGLGFFAPFFNADARVHIWGPPSTRFHLRERLTRYLSPPLFPVRLRDLPCHLEYHELLDEEVRIGGLRLRADLVCHPGTTSGYRITEAGATLAYLPDHEPALGSQHFPDDAQWTSGFDIAEGAALLIHDTQYMLSQYPSHVGWGHSAMEHTLAFARLAGVKKLVAFHHDPAHDDARLDAMWALAESNGSLPFEFVVGAEGAAFSVESAHQS